MPYNRNRKTPPSPDAVNLTPYEAAFIIGVSVQTLAIWRHDGRFDGLRYRKVGGRVVYERAGVERWLRSRERASTIQTEAPKVSQ